MAHKINRTSCRTTEPKSQGASQAMLYGIGMSDADMKKAQVGISSVWYEGNTCNMHLLDLAEQVKKGVTQAGLVGMRFNTIGVSDGISMGTEGMSFSLQSREIIADSIETVMSAQWYDANISLPGCDKNMPGCLIAMARINRPSLMVYGGTIRAGDWDPAKPYVKVLAGVMDAGSDWRSVHRAQSSVYGWRADYHLDVLDFPFDGESQGRCRPGRCRRNRRPACRFPGAVLRR